MIPSHVSLVLPENYIPIKFPGLIKILIALRSGKFEKCKGELCKYTGLRQGVPHFQYCTLGVMTLVFNEIHTAEQTKNRVQSAEDPSQHDSFKLLHLAHPPNDVLNFFFTDRIGSLPPNVYVVYLEDGVERKQYHSISHINDSKELNLTFSEIANLLEKIYSDNSNS